MLVRVVSTSMGGWRRDDINPVWACLSMIPISVFMAADFLRRDRILNGK